jgi:hypothetical protein
LADSTGESGHAKVVSQQVAVISAKSRKAVPKDKPVSIIDLSEL